MRCVVRYLGVIGIDIPLSKIESTFHNVVGTELHAFMLNLADGTAVIHPHEKQSYEVCIY